ncbi:MAG: HNH endonuclease [Acetobacterium sp.]|nr:HNH endonuclease [Acetobacterium sp.]
MARNNWTREETILAFELYCRTPFGKIHSHNTEIIELSKLLERTPSAVSMKMCNLASYDPELRKRGVSGLANGSKLESQIWQEFQNDWEALAFESKAILASIENKVIEIVANIDLDNLPPGKDKSSVVKQRIGQNFFRSAVLNAYESRCCITGISMETLLIASHIKPWKHSDVKTERTNPTNGLCLNALHDKAFDQGLITINKKFEIMVSHVLKNDYIDEQTKNWIVNFEGKHIETPHKFLPDGRFIEYHNDAVFRG